MQEKHFFVYILLCSNNTYYIGYTTDLARRFQEHLQGTAKCKYTRSFKAIKILQNWQVNDKGTALRLEHYLKKLPRQAKQQLVNHPQTLAARFNLTGVDSL